MNMGMKIGQQLRFKMIEWSKMTTYITAYLLIGVAFTGVLIALASYDDCKQAEFKPRFIALSIGIWPMVIVGVIMIVAIENLKAKKNGRMSRWKK